ncbi:MAG: hypothetical protein IT169_03615 [Bryobacterales bacterium]|nr:hypothetical protein [Bryobacterales bacterium]
MIRNLMGAILGVLILITAAKADPITLTLIPSNGAVSGAPGDTVGWGFSLTNGSDNYLMVANSYFCQAGEDPFFSTCTQLLGVYSDFIAANGIMLAPSQSWMETYDGTIMAGVGEYTIDNAATPGSVDAGAISVVYNLFEGDPFVDGIPVDGDFEIFTTASVTVEDRISPVPEPTPLLLLIGPLAVLIARERRRREQPR